MRKLILSIALIAILATGTVFADYPGGLGIGLQGGGGGAWEGGGGFAAHRGAALSLKLPDMPIFWTIDARFNEWYTFIGVAGDTYFIHAPLVDNILHWYIGWGLGVGLGFWNSDWAGDSSLLFDVFARLPIGLSLQLPLNAGPLNVLEFFLQVVPTLGVHVSPNFSFPAGGWGGNLGFRLWF